MSGFPDLEELVDAAVTAAELETGVPAQIAVSRSRLDLAELGEAIAIDEGDQELDKPNLGRWTQEEDAFVRDSLGLMSLEEIGKAIGRSATAVKVRFTRKGWSAPSKQPGEMVAREVGWRLGKCGKSIKALIDREILPGRRIPGERGTHVVKEVTFYRWAINPENWIYFKHMRVRDPKLQRLLELKRERWGDKWLTTGRVASMHKLPGGSNDVTRHIYAGSLPAVKYQFWRVRRSVAESYRFTQGRGSSSGLEWPAEADAFLVLCAAIGVPHMTIAALLKWPRWRPGYRLSLLKREGRIEELSDQFGLGVKPAGGQGEGQLFADWRMHAARFPGLRGAASRLLKGEELGNSDLLWLRGVLRSWARRHAGGDSDRRRLVGYLRAAGRNCELRIRKAWREMQAWGVDPFELGDQPDNERDILSDT